MVARVVRLQHNPGLAPYVTAGSAWLLTYLAFEFARSRGTAVFLAGAWVACWFVPGALPIPDFLPVPLAMVLTTIVALTVIALNAWVIVGRSRAATAAPVPVESSLCRSSA